MELFVLKGGHTDHPLQEIGFASASNYLGLDLGNPRVPSVANYEITSYSKPRTFLWSKP